MSLDKDRTERPWGAVIDWVPACAERTGLVGLTMTYGLADESLQMVKASY